MYSNAPFRASLAVLLVGACFTSALASAPRSQEIGTARKQSLSDPSASALNNLLVKADAAIKSQDYAAAAKDLEDYLAQRPQEASAHFQLGYAYTGLGRTADARAEYQRATELDPKMSEAFLNLGLSELASDPAAAVAPLQRAVELMPSEAQPKIILASALARSGKLDDAIRQYQAANELDGRNYALHLGLAEALSAKGRLSDSENEFRAAIALDGSDPAAHLGLGNCLFAQKKYSEAANELAIYLKAQPHDEKTRMARISALIETAKYDDAVAELDRSAASAQPNVAYLKLRYEALAGAKRNDEALATLLKAAALAPQDAEIHFKIGQAALDKKDYRSAVREFATALGIQPADNLSLAGLVSAEYLGKNYAEALKAIDLLSQRETLPPASLFARADCYDKLGKKQEALDAYEKFLAVNTDRNGDMYFAASARARDLRRELKIKQP